MRCQSAPALKMDINENEHLSPNHFNGVQILNQSFDNVCRTKSGYVLLIPSHNYIC
ncbi:unnamed protein product, partial [Staurois parvus]